MKKVEACSGGTLPACHLFVRTIHRVTRHTREKGSKMRRAAFVLAALIVAAAVTPAQAGSYYENSCLAVVNKTKYSYDIKIQDPTAYNGLTWTVDPFEDFTFTIESQPIHSKTGYWHVRWTGTGGGQLEDTWQYHADYTFRGMCPAGTYVVTLDW